MKFDDIEEPKSEQCREPNSNHAEVAEDPETPPNSLTLNFPVNQQSSNKYNTSMEHSFLRRIGFDKNLISRRWTGMVTSTPFASRTRKLNHSLPIPDPSFLRNQTNLNSSLTVGPERIPYEYVNPFTPEGKEATTKVKAQKKMKRLSIGCALEIELSRDSESDTDYPERSRLSEFNISRFTEEFILVESIGRGQFGNVYKCVNKLNGCVYAVKQTIKPVETSLEEQSIRNEIYAHGILNHAHIVRNFSCWSEHNVVYIQNEYCNGGNLEEHLRSCDNRAMPEHDVEQLLLHMGKALRFIHGKALAHVDVKPANIFLVNQTGEEDLSDFDSDNENEKDESKIIFKLGDLGHVTVTSPVPDDVMEGDCRYLSPELLNEDYSHLDRSDIFALGLTAYEAAGGGELPKNGEVWQRMRGGELPDEPKIVGLSPNQMRLIRDMIRPVPLQRPSADDLVKRIETSLILSSPDRDFYRVRRRNAQLLQKNELSDRFMKALVQVHRRHWATANSVSTTANDSKRRRVVGKKTNRSISTNF